MGLFHAIAGAIKSAIRLVVAPVFVRAWDLRSVMVGVVVSFR